MSASVIAILAVPLALALLAWWLDNQVQSSRHLVATTEDFFPVAIWIYGVFVACGGMCAAIIFLGLDESQTQGARNVMLGIGSMGVAGSLAALWWYAKCAIHLTEIELIVETPISKKSVRLDNIKDVRIAGGMIILDEGKIPRLVVPIIYRKTSLLLANIEARLKEQNRRAVVKGSPISASGQ